VLAENLPVYQQHSNPSRKLRDVATGHLPEDFVQSIREVEKRVANKAIDKKIAAFDLDNTLLVGDIGEAVFAALRLQGHIPGFGWKSYRRLLATRPEEAYRTVVTAMSGLSERLIQRSTLDVSARRDDYLELENSFIQIPYANPVMLLVVNHLRALGYQICVITASNEISARIVAWKYFSIPPFYVYGIRQAIHNGDLTSELIPPLPMREGKVDVYKKFMGGTAPLVTASDSFLDIPLLQMTDPRGLSLWVGEEKVGYELARQKVAGRQDFCFLTRPAQLQLDEKRFDD
jgi:phosphoserine phosphatase